MTAVSVDLGTGTTVGTTASIGVEPHSNWTQQTGFPNFSVTNLEDDTTAATTLDLELSNARGNRSSRASGSGDLFNMYTRGVGVDNIAGTDLIITEIPYSAYNVYLYLCEEAASVSGDLITITDGTTTYYYENQGSDNFNGGTLARISSTSSGSPDTSGNYVLFEGLTSSSVTINFVTDGVSNLMLATGMQIVEDSGGGSTIIADTGVYSYSGNDAGVVKSSSLEADTGLYSYIGADVDLISGAELEADTGDYFYVGQNAEIVRSSQVQADIGSYVYLGGDANLIYIPAGSFILVADAGAYFHSGNDVQLSASRLAAADVGGYLYQGQDAALSAGISLIADLGSYTYAGSDAGFIKSNSLISESGVYAYQGFPASLIGAATPSISTGIFSFIDSSPGIAFSFVDVQLSGVASEIGQDVGIMSIISSSDSVAQSEIN